MQALSRYLQDSSLIIEGCALLDQTQPGGLRRHQDVLIIGQRIVEIAPHGRLTTPIPTATRIIEAREQLAIPGLINAHTHSPENLLKATSPSLPLELWLVPLFAGIISWSPRLVYLSAMLGAIEMLKGGTTSVLDHLWMVEGVASEYMNAAMQAYADVGIRAAVAPCIEDRDLVLEKAQQHQLFFPPHTFVDRFEEWPSIDTQLNALEQFLAQWHNTADGRLRVLTGPSGIHWCSPRLLHHCVDLSERYRTGLHLHAVETEVQALVIRDVLGEGGIAYLDTLGVLRRGTSLAHAIWLEEGDLERIAGSGATIVHNPISNLRLGSGRFPFSEARSLGVHVALGSDGSASNDTQNMFGVLKMAGLLHNTPSSDYQTWPAASAILDSATRDGATALAIPDELGTLAPGKLADLVLLDLNSSAFFPLNDPYLHLVYCENGSSVTTVIVNGELVVQRGNVLTVDEQAIRNEVRARCAAIWPGFPHILDYVTNTREVFTTLDTLRRLLLRQEEHAF